MSLKEDVEKLEQKAENLEAQSFAKSFLEEFKKTNKRLFIIILLLLAYSVFITYLFMTTGTITEITDTTGGGNACIGDNCFNGDINGEGD